MNMGKKLIVVLLIVLLIGAGISLYFWNDRRTLRNKLFDNIYYFEAKNCPNLESQQERNVCEDAIRCYVEETVNKVEYLNLRRWISETGPHSFNPYYTLRGHLRDEGITESQLNAIQSSCGAR